MQVRVGKRGKQKKLKSRGIEVRLGIKSPITHAPTGTLLLNLLSI